MIAFFPSIYPDELLYSQLARYYAKSGYSSYISAARDLYQNKNTKPSIEFINAFTNDALQAICRTSTFEAVITEHTMFSYYARFLDLERRKHALQAMLEMRNDYYNLLCFPKNKTKQIRYLRYCPICADTDRKQYGETYWHRMHQMIHIDICPIHACQLIHSDIPIDSKASPSLITAEETVKEDVEIVQSSNERECQLARYTAAVFTAPLDMDASGRIGDYLHAMLEHTSYVSLRGQQRKIQVLFQAYQTFYENLNGQTLPELWQLQKIFTNDRFGTYEICLLAMFLKIPPDELIHMRLPQRRQQDRFDAEIVQLHEQGLTYAEIARRLCASYDVVKSIGERRYGRHRNCSESTGSSKGGAKQKDWADIDAKRLSEVIDCIKRLQNADTRPVRISIGMIERLLGYPKKSMYRCPRCMAEIKKHEECMEEYWTREVLWAVKSIKENNLPLNFTNIQKITNMRKENFIRCAPHMKQYPLVMALIQRCEED